MKIQYILDVNGGTDGKPYIFSYGNTKEIELKVSEQKVSICTELTRDYREEIHNSYLFDLFKEGIRRSALISALKYKEELVINTAMVKCQTKQGNAVTTFTDEFKMSSALQNSLGAIPEEFGDDKLIQIIMDIKRSKYGYRESALYSYLYSKNKKFGLDRFTYLWMAFNGYYASINPGTKTNNKEGMEVLLKKYKLGEKIISSRSKREIIGKKVKLLLGKEKVLPTRISLESGIHQELAKKIKELLKENEIKLNLTPYGYLLTDFAYYLRCSIFHAQKSLPLFTFENDLDMKALNTVNGLLEDFLDCHLAECFLIAGGAN